MKNHWLKKQAPLEERARNYLAEITAPYTDANAYDWRGNVYEDVCIKMVAFLAREGASAYDLNLFMISKAGPTLRRDEIVSPRVEWSLDRRPYHLVNSKDGLYYYVREILRRRTERVDPVVRALEAEDARLKEAYMAKVREYQSKGEQVPFEIRWAAPTHWFMGL